MRYIYSTTAVIKTWLAQGDPAHHHGARDDERVVSFLEALADAGLMIVPVEPSEAEVEAASLAFESNYQPDDTECGMSAALHAARKAVDVEEQHG